MTLGATQVQLNGKAITWFRCADCGYVSGDISETHTMRPNNKFCDSDCMEYVLTNSLQESRKRPKGWKQWLCSRSKR